MTRDEVLRALRLDTTGRYFSPFGDDSFSSFIRPLMVKTFDRTPKYPGNFMGETWAKTFRIMLDHNLFTEKELDEIYCRFILVGLHREA